MLSVNSNYDIVLDSENKDIVELGKALGTISSQNYELALIASAVCISDCFLKLCPCLDPNETLKDFFFILSRATPMDVRHINRHVCSIINNKNNNKEDCSLASCIKESCSFLEVLLKKEYILSNLDYELINSNYNTFKYMVEATDNAIRPYLLKRCEK